MNGFDLKAFMLENDLTENQVSDITGAKVRTVKSWMSGERNIKPASIKLLKKHIGGDDIVDIATTSPTILALSASVSMLFNEVAILKGKNEGITPETAHKKMKEQASLILSKL